MEWAPWLGMYSFRPFQKILKDPIVDPKKNCSADAQLSTSTAD